MQAECSGFVAHKFSEVKNFLSYFSTMYCIKKIKQVSYVDGINRSSGFVVCVQILLAPFGVVVVEKYFPADDGGNP